MKIDWSNYIEKIDACPNPHGAVRALRAKLAQVPPLDHGAVLKELETVRKDPTRPPSGFSIAEERILEELTVLCEKMSARTHPYQELNRQLQVGIEVEFGGFELAAFSGTPDDPKPVSFDRTARLAESEARTPFSRIPFVIWEVEGLTGMTAANANKRDSLLEYVGAPFSFSESDERIARQRQCIQVLSQLQRGPRHRNGPLRGYPEFRPLRELIEAYNAKVHPDFRVIADQSHPFTWYYALREQATMFDQGNFDYPLRRIDAGADIVNLFLPSEIVGKETRSLVTSPRDVFGDALTQARAIIGGFFGGLSSGSRKKLTGLVALFIRAAAMREHLARSTMRDAQHNFVFKNSFLLMCKTPLNDLLRLGFSQRSQASIASVVRSRGNELRGRLEAACAALRKARPLRFEGLSRDSEAPGFVELFNIVFVPGMNPRYPGETEQAYGRRVNWEAATLATGNASMAKALPFCDSIKPADAIPVQLYVTELPGGRREIEPMVVLESRLGYADKLVGFAVRQDPYNKGPGDRLLRANDLSTSYPDDYDSDG